MKGQLFIIAAIIIVIILVSLRGSLNILQVINDKRVLESDLLQIEFQNLRLETLKVSINSYNQSQNITQNLIGFLAFAKNSFSGRNMDLQGLAAITSYPTVVASQNTQLNVTIYNFFDQPINTLILNFSNPSTVQTVQNLNPFTSYSTNFTFNIASNTNQVLWIYYNFTTETDVQNVTISLEIGKSRQTNFFDLRLQGTNGQQSDLVNQSFYLS